MTFNLPYLPPNTIVPPTDDFDVIVQYFNRLYEEIAYNVNFRDFTFYSIAISSTATNIPNLATFGAYIVCISGEDSSQPVQTATLVKSDSGIAGVVNVLGTQAGTGSWAANNLFLTSTASNFQVRHDRTGVTANFNIRIIGTQ